MSPKLFAKPIVFVFIVFLLAACQRSEPAAVPPTDPSNTAPTPTSSEERAVDEEIEVSWETLSSFPIGDKMGYVDPAGNVIIEPIFDIAGPFTEGLGLVQIDGKWGYIDPNGDFVIEPRFDRADYFYEGMAEIQVGELRGFINSTGDLVVEPQYPVVGRFSQGVAAVQAGKVVGANWGYIDKTGEIVIDPQFQYASPFTEEGLAKVSINNKYGFIDKEGQFFVEISLDGAESFSEGYAAVKLDRTWGFIDTNNEFVIEPQYQTVGRFSEGLTWGRSGDLNSKVEFFDPSGNVIFDLSAERAGEFSEGLVDILIGEKWGYFDTQGQVVIPPIFDIAGSFHNDVAWVNIGEEWGTINSKGEFIKPFAEEPSGELYALATFSLYQMALRDLNGGLALSLVDQETIAWYETIRTHALTLDRIELDQLSFMDKYMVLVARLGLTEAELESMTGEDLLKTAVVNNWIKELALEDFTITHMEINGDSAELFVEEVPDTPTFYFVNEQEGWKISPAQSNEMLNLAVEEEIVNRGASTDDEILRLLYGFTSGQIDETIFDGPRQ